MVETCPICGIQRLSSVFYWSSNQKPATPIELSSKICNIAKRRGKDVSRCINGDNINEFDKNITWQTVYDNL